MKILSYLLIATFSLLVLKVEAKDGTNIAQRSNPDQAFEQEHSTEEATTQPRPRTLCKPPCTNNEACKKGGLKGGGCNKVTGCCVKASTPPDGEGRSESVSEEMGIPTDEVKANSSSGEGFSKPSHPGASKCSPKCKSHEECKKKHGGGTAHCVFSNGCCAKY